jgi:hypothetical protein
MRMRVDKHGAGLWDNSIAFEKAVGLGLDTSTTWLYGTCMTPSDFDIQQPTHEQYYAVLRENREMKQRLVKEMCLTRSRTEMLEDFGPDYEEYL